MASERTYEVTEPLMVANVFLVRAGTRAEAVQKVHDHEYDEVVMTDAMPIGVMTERNARWINRPRRTS